MYIKAKLDKIKEHREFNEHTRHLSKDGLIMLNEKDVMGCGPGTFEENVELIEGIVLSTAEAKTELSKKYWR